MPFLRSLLSVARMWRHAPHIGTDLPPDDAVRLDVPDKPLAAASEALGEGDWKPAAELLARTREHGWWETRDRYVGRLAGACLAGPSQRPGETPGGWLDAWWEASGGDQDAAVVRAEVTLRRAWQAGTARTGPLREAFPLFRAAAEANPYDPVPWRIALTRARALRAPRPDFDALWAGAAARSPHHYGCHVSAVRYLCADGTAGSYEEAFDLADAAAGRVLPGSLVRGLPLIAAYEVLARGRGPEAGDRIDRAIDRALELSAWYGTGEPEPAELRNVLAQVLIVRQRWGDALELFRAIGPYATRFPWARLGGDPLAEFLELRDGVRVQLASSLPLRARPGGSWA